MWVWRGRGNGKIRVAGIADGVPYLNLHNFQYVIFADACSGLVSTTPSLMSEPTPIESESWMVLPQHAQQSYNIDAITAPADG